MTNCYMKLYDSEPFAGLLFPEDYCSLHHEKGEKIT
jgi:hypothetical protein